MPLLLFLLSSSIGKGDAKLKHVEPPKESLSMTQSKVLKAVEGKHELKHVDAPETGLSEAAKQAFLNKEKDQE